MEQNYIGYDLCKNSTCRWSDNQLYQSRHAVNRQYQHIYAFDKRGRIACFTARVPSNKVRKAPSQHGKETGYNQLKEVLPFYKPPEISSYAIHPPKSSSKVTKYEDYPKMYAKHKVDHDVHYKESCIDEHLIEHGQKGKYTQSTNTPYSFLICSEYLKQRLDRKATLEELERDDFFKNKDLLVKPETRDVSCGKFSIRRKSTKRIRLKRISTSKRIKRFVIYKRVYRTMKELEHLFKVSKSKWEMAVAKESEESVKDTSVNEIVMTQTSGTSITSASEIKIVMTTSDTAITPFEVDVPKISESSPIISSSMTPLKVEHEENDSLQQTSTPSELKTEEVTETAEETETGVHQTSATVSLMPMVEMKDVSTECYFKRKRRKSAARSTRIGLLGGFSSAFLKELRNAICSIPKMSYLILVTFYALP